jgi:hypothetical protein
MTIFPSYYEKCYLWAKVSLHFKKAHQNYQSPKASWFGNSTMHALPFPRD